MSMRDASISELVESLKHEDAAVRDRATQELWQRWFTQRVRRGYPRSKQPKTIWIKGGQSKPPRF